MLEILKDFAKTSIEQIVDTYYTLENWLLSSSFARWWRMLSDWQRYWAHSSFWFVLGIFSVLVGRF